jgi:hypothetical protein
MHVFFFFTTDMQLQELGVEKLSHRLRMLAAFKTHSKHEEAIMEHAKRQEMQQRFESVYHLMVSVERLSGTLANLVSLNLNSFVVVHCVLMNKHSTKTDGRLAIT